VIAGSHTKTDMCLIEGMPLAFVDTSLLELLGVVAPMVRHVVVA
jgi:hypothetical protein